MEFRGVQCWDQVKVQQTMLIEAEQPSDTVFLATMARLPITRSLPGTAGQAFEFQPYDRERFLKEFLDPNRQFTLVPIVGTSGTGKSHLVRWLSTQIKSSPQRLVIRIPKYNTNLRDVIGLLLKEFSGRRFEEFKSRIESAVTGQDPSKFAFEILTTLARLAGTKTAKERGYDQVISPHVTDYLLDGPLRNAWLDKKGPIYKFATEALKGRNSDKAAPFEFTERDIPSVDLAIKLGPTTRLFFGQVNGNLDLRNALLARLNKYLPMAIQQVHDFTGEDLLMVLREMRAELFKQGKELVLLIEDLALLQGLQEQLIAALVENPVEGGRQVSCTIRTAVAVTTGYLDGVDTVRTRSTFIVGMDGKIEQQNVDQFAGRYLNAARLGESALQQGGPYPNACSPCRFQAECHRVFGHHHDADFGDIGLYPFNAAALNTMKGIQGAEFNPRQMISAVLRLTLLESYGTLAEGKFPTQGFIQEFTHKAGPLDLAVQTELGRKVPDSGMRSRVDTVLRLWGYPEGALPEVLQAFGLPGFISDASQKKIEDAPEPPKPVAEPVRPDPPQKKDPLIAALEEWASGSNLTQTVGNTMRDKLFGRLGQLIPWEVLPLTKELAEKLDWRPRLLYWEGQSVGHRPQGDFSLILPQEGQSRVEVANVMKWVLTGEDSTSAKARLESQVLLQKWADHLKAQLEAVSTRTLVQVCALAKPLVQAMGEDAQNPQEMVRALAGPIFSQPTGPLEGVYEPLGTLRTKLAESLDHLIGVRKGPGATRFWEVQSLAHALGELSLAGVGKLPNLLVDLDREVQRLSRQVQTQDEERRVHATAFLHRLKSSFPWPMESEQIKEALEEFADACKAAISDDVLDGKLSELRRFQDAQELESLCKRLTEIGSLLQTMEASQWADSALGRLRFWHHYYAQDPRELEAVLSRVSAVLENSTKTAKETFYKITKAAGLIGQTKESIAKELKAIEQALTELGEG